ncbi:hypothetical protein EI555_016455, partial [Monodon monoceros]
PADLGPGAAGSADYHGLCVKPAVCRWRPEEAQEDAARAAEEPQLLHGAGICKWFNVRMGFGFLSMTARAGVTLDPPDKKKQSNNTVDKESRRFRRTPRPSFGLSRIHRITFRPIDILAQELRRRRRKEREREKRREEPKWRRGCFVETLMLLHQFLSMFPLLKRLEKKAFGEVIQSHIVTVKIVVSFINKLHQQRQVLFPCYVHHIVSDNGKEKKKKSLARTTQRSNLPTWGQTKQLVSQAQELVEQQNNPVTPVTLVLAMLATVSCVPSVNAATYWAYEPTLLLHNRLPADERILRIPSFSIKMGNLLILDVESHTPHHLVTGEDSGNYFCMKRLLGGQVILIAGHKVTILNRKSKNQFPPFMTINFPESNFERCNASWNNNQIWCTIDYTKGSTLISSTPVIDRFITLQKNWDIWKTALTYSNTPVITCVAPPYTLLIGSINTDRRIKEYWYYDYMTSKA